MRDNLKDKIYGNISYNTNEIISKANTIAIMSCGIGASLLPNENDSLLASLLLLGANIINVSYAIFSRNSESHTKEVQKIKTLYQEFLSEYVKLNRIFEFQNPIEIYTFYNKMLYDGYLSKNKEFHFGETTIRDIKDIYSLNNDNLAIFRRRQIGLIYQFYNLIPILNVEENITLPLKLDNKNIDKQRLDELIKVLGLEERRTHLPNELSGGQQQRTSIGRAMINNPALMLADEPTGNLDSKASDEIISLLKISNKKFNQTVIMITHDLEIAKEADRVITIEDGKIIRDENN